MQVHAETKTAAEIVAGYAAARERLGRSAAAPAVSIPRPIIVNKKETRKLYTNPIGPSRPKRSCRMRTARSALREDTARRFAMEPDAMLRECSAGMPYLNRLIRPFVVASLMSHGRTWMEMTSHCRLSEINICRQEIMTILYGNGHSYATIGEWLSRHHTTVLNGVRAHEKRVACAETGEAGARP